MTSIFSFWIDFLHAWYTLFSGYRVIDGHFCQPQFTEKDGCVLGADPLEGYVG